jgi:hypothetical protein
MLVGRSYKVSAGNIPTLTLNQSSGIIRTSSGLELLQPSSKEQHMNTTTGGKVGRPEKLTFERVSNIVNLSKETGRTLKALAAERHIPYISLVVACKRHNLQTRPRKATETLVA